LDLVTHAGELQNSTIELSVYPNPSNGIFHIVDKGNTLHEDNRELIVYNMLGEKIGSVDFASGNISIDLSGQSKGIYFIRLYSGKEYLSKKLILQ
jgi:hypothetical protein